MAWEIQRNEDDFVDGWTHKKTPFGGRIKHILLGRTLENKDLEGEKLGRFWGVPIMASDAVSSVAYAIEEMLLVLAPVLGLAALNYLGYVSAPIILLFIVLAISYSQIISSYPSGGGAYVVSSENIGRKTAMTAASALIVDYVMTVAVSLSAAAAALSAAFPALHGYRLPLALAFLCVITLLNLRGLRESSKVFGIPTYGFIAIMLALIFSGVAKFIAGGLSPAASPVSAPPAAGGAGLVFLLLTAFSSGCSALTGIEAVSNAVPSFRQPAQRNARHVLFILAGIIIAIFGGSVFLVISLKIVPVAGNTVISQLGSAIFGTGPMYYLLQFATSLILLLAANTAYNGLPTLLAILAQDGYMPRQFMQRGTRLSFSNGILFIFFCAGLLMIVFNAETHSLIPLYSVGVFLSFTLSQGGMVMRWKRVKGAHYHYKLAVNGLGAIMTAAGTAIVFVTKFRQGSWLLAIVIPVIALVMNRIFAHYRFVANQLKSDNWLAHYHKSVSQDKNLCIVLVGAINRSSLKALNYANLLSSNVLALHISTDAQQSAVLKADWEKSGIDIPLEVVESPYRDLIGPIEAYIGRREAGLAPGDTISVVMTRFVEEHWFDNMLHNQTAYFIERRLRNHRNVATVLVPYLYSRRFAPV
jgi:amino acid transporter